MAIDEKTTVVGESSSGLARAFLFSFVGAAIFCVLIWFVGWGRVLGVLRSADPSIIVSASLMITIATLLGAINSFMVAADDTGLRFLPYFGTYWAAWAIGQIIPGQIGDVVGMSFFLRKQGLTLPTAVGRLTLDKLVSLFCTLLFSAGLLLVFDLALPRLAGFLAGCAAIFLFGCLLIAPRFPALDNRFTGWRGHLINGLREAHRIAATRPGILLLDGVFTVVKLVVIGAAYWIVLRSLWPNVGSLLDVSIIANSAGLIAYLPISANGVGTVEAGGVYLFGMQSVPAPVVLAAYLILRFSNLVLAWLGTVVILALAAWRRRNSI